MKLWHFGMGLSALVLAGCSSSGTGSATGTGGSGGAGATAGSGGFATGGTAGSGGLAAGGTAGSGASAGSGGGGGISVACQDLNGGPTLLVVSDAAGAAGKSETVLRIPLSFGGPVTGLTLDSVEEQDGSGTTLRAWTASDFHGPPGFDGSVQADPANYYEAVLAASAPSVQAETDACAAKPWERNGKVIAKGTTHEGGPFQVECGLALGLGGKGPESLRFACAKGLPGWLEEQTGISNVTSPVLAALAQSEIHVENTSSAAWDGFVATSATLHAYFADTFLKPCTSPPDTWDFPANGLHQLWRGQTSNDAWSGPVAAGTTDWANWMWQLTGIQFPDGVCFAPNPQPPPDPSQMCQEPMLQITLSGSSGAGAWQWESDLFDCYDLSSP